MELNKQMFPGEARTFLAMAAAAAFAVPPPAAGALAQSTLAERDLSELAAGWNCQAEALKARRPILLVQGVVAVVVVEMSQQFCLGAALLVPGRLVVSGNQLIQWIMDQVIQWTFSGSVFEYNSHSYGESSR